MSHPNRQKARQRLFTPVFAGFRPIGDLLPQVIAIVCRSATDVGAPLTSGGCPGGSRRLPDRQKAVECQPRSLTGRHQAPTGAPRSTKVRMGEEGTPSREAVTCRAVSARRA